MQLANLQQGITRSFGRSSLLLKKHSPEILLGVGLIGMVVGAVMAAKATLKAEKILNDSKGSIEQIKILYEEHTPSYTKDDHDKDLAVTYVKTGMQFATLYGPSIGVISLSVLSILASHGVMTRRQVAIVAAYNLLQESFKSYRSRVVEELGETADKMYHLGVRSEEYNVKEVDEEGKAKSVKKTGLKYDPNFKSDYARFFDEASTQWSKDPSYNLVFLKAQQNYANDLLNARGHVFLNEVYDMLGIPRNKAGSVVGWVLNKGGDNFVDFDIYNVNNAPGRDFVNGYNRSILLDFNVDGVIFDLI